jgi:hypothetical protein
MSIRLSELDIEGSIAACASTTWLSQYSDHFLPASGATTYPRKSTQTTRCALLHKQEIVGSPPGVRRRYQKMARTLGRYGASQQTKAESKHTAQQHITDQESTVEIERGDDFPCIFVMEL